ncbi:uncharacterized protein LOC133519954 [Cydia pomonella]|uniref:uncharacterized protein LOC133519954 n=1 Tax=Cydia pomonella TaxID=82600 RepID=UPI002ADDC2D8|nr:uncharacterized protein LOC133519954 [Cydia pomonella]
MLHSHHSHLRPKVYKTLHTQPLATTAATPTFEMADLHHLAIFHQLQRQLDEQSKYIAPTTTTENPKLSHVLNLGVRILPKQGIPFVTNPHELSRNTPFQPIPRIAYHNKFNVVSEKMGRPQAHTRYHLNNPNKHLRFKPNVQYNISN